MTIQLNPQLQQAVHAMKRNHDASQLNAFSLSKAELSAVSKAVQAKRPQEPRTEWF
ncbi:hypothetical protein [Paenibacillus aestuarii]|uniref:Uncharacterized protein n=1 Tax=Paenibacillus aestuarii TaxID=516965 RepID=A0ABW0KEQ1_9BACL|nr:hypothetical protein [Paenibacillus aestuarii]